MRISGSRQLCVAVLVLQRLDYRSILRITRYCHGKLSVRPSMSVRPSLTLIGTVS